ncbi:MAG TPA: HEAT repeat domain-containing protein [Ktedonobacteraceae bacterium]|nr:HEAT repeat domain-containing protein [Ktedonobacteraceae bacterium]
MCLAAAPNWTSLVYSIEQRMLHPPLHSTMTTTDQPDDANALAQLRRELYSINATVRIPAIRRAVHFQEKAPRELLLKTLKDHRVEVHTAAAETIEALKPWITDEQWLETLSGVSELYHIALSVLDAIGKDAPFKSLASASISLNSPLRAYAQRIIRPHIALWSVERATPFIQYCTEQLQHPSAYRRMVSIELLGMMNDRVPAETLLPALHDSEMSVRLAVLEQLSRRGRQGDALPIEPIVELLDDPDEHIRVRSMWVLETQKAALPIERLIAAMHDPEEGVVHMATTLLGCKRSVQALPVLIEHLLYCPNDYWMDYTREAIDAICELYTHVPLEPLLKAVYSETEQVSRRAILLLSLLKERTPIDSLVELLKHKDSRMRARALTALGRHLTRIPISIVVAKLRDHNKIVRRVARLILLRSEVEIPAELLLPFLDCPENKTRVLAIKLLRSRVRLERLLAATQDHKWTVRAQALEVLGEMGERVPLALFLEALCERNIGVRHAAIEALCKQGERAPLAIIFGALHDSRRVHRAAAEGLEKIGTRLPREWLLQALVDPKGHVRIVVIQLLKAIEYEEAFPFNAVRRML